VTSPTARTVCLDDVPQLEDHGHGQDDAVARFALHHEPRQAVDRRFPAAGHSRRLPPFEKEPTQSNDGGCPHQGSGGDSQSSAHLDYYS
jgi:hypothetical protein